MFGCEGIISLRRICLYVVTTAVSFPPLTLCVGTQVVSNFTANQEEADNWNGTKRRDPKVNCASQDKDYGDRNGYDEARCTKRSADGVEA